MDHHKYILSAFGGIFMKIIRKALSVTCFTAMSATCAFALYACNGDPKPSSYEYTVSLKAPNGSVLPDAEIQLAKVENDAEGEKTQPVKVDENGKATFTFNEEATFNVYASGFSKLYLMPEGPLRVTPAAKSANITLSYDLKTSQSGNGTAEHPVDMLTGKPDTSKLSYVTYNGYSVTQGVYKSSAAEANKTVYYRFRPTRSGIYTIWTEGTADTRFQHYIGSQAGIFINDTDELIADDISETNKNFSYELEVSDELIEHKAADYFFGISVKEAAAFPADFHLLVERTGDYVAPEQLPLTSVKPQSPLDPFGSPIDQPVGNLNDKINWLLPDGSIKAAKDEDGYYRVSSDGVKADGALIWAAVGAPVRSESIGNILSVFTTDFVGMGDELQSNLTFSDGVTYKKNYYEFAVAYKAASNNQGLYPVTDELKEFLTLFSEKNKKWLENCNFVFESGYEWMFACATYKTDTNPAGNAPENPIEIDFGTQSLLLPANTKVYYKLALTSNLNSDDVAITSSTVGLTIDDGNKTYTVTPNSNVSVSVPRDKLNSYVFSVIADSDQRCAQFTLRIRGGDKDNPLELVCSDKTLKAPITVNNGKLWYFIDNTQLNPSTESVTISSSSTGLRLVVPDAKPVIDDTASSTRPLNVSIPVSDLRSPFYLTAERAGEYTFTVTETIALPGSNANAAVEIEPSNDLSITYLKDENGLSFYATFTAETNGIYEFALADATNAKRNEVVIYYNAENEVPHHTTLGQSRTHENQRPVDIPEKHKILVELTAGTKVIILFTCNGLTPFEVGFSLTKQ